jgi:hypothetical protein
MAVALFTAYMGAYYATRTDIVSHATISLRDDSHVVTHDYRIWGIRLPTAVEIFFVPAEWIDYVLRPEANKWRMERW